MRFYSVMIPRHDSRLSALSTTQTRGTLASRVSFSLWLPTGSPAGAGWLSERPGHAHSHTGNLAAPPRPRARERTSNLPGFATLTASEVDQPILSTSHLLQPLPLHITSALLPHEREKPHHFFFFANTSTIMSDTLVYKGSLEGHGGWVTAIATSSENPDMILTASRGAYYG